MSTDGGEDKGKSGNTTWVDVLQGALGLIAFFVSFQGYTAAWPFLVVASMLGAFEKSAWGTIQATWLVITIGLWFSGYSPIGDIALWIYIAIQAIEVFEPLIKGAKAFKSWFR